ADMIPVLPLRLTYQPQGHVQLPTYPGSLWRSAIGASLRRQTCITGAPSCDGCPLSNRCAYGFLFDTPQPAHSDLLVAQYDRLPHPYIISPCSPQGIYGPDKPVSVDLTVIAPGQRFLPELLGALNHLRLGKTSLDKPTIQYLPPT